MIELSSRYIADYWDRSSYPYSWIFTMSPNYYFNNYEYFSKARIPTYSTIDMSVYANTACSWYYYTRR